MPLPTPNLSFTVSNVIVGVDASPIPNLPAPIAQPPWLKYMLDAPNEVKIPFSELALAMCKSYPGVVVPIPTLLAYVPSNPTNIVVVAPA